jgi:hypothetical protein
MSNPRSNQQFIFRVDSSDRIVAVNGDWRAFVRDQEAVGFFNEPMANHSLWGLIDNRGTRHLLKSVLRNVRRTGLPSRIPFRCDGKQIQRLMELKIEREKEGHTRFTTRILRQAPRHPDAAVASSVGLVIQCAWCQRLAISQKLWLDLDEAIGRFRLFDAPLHPHLSHGICKTCYGQHRMTTGRSVALAN